MVGPRFNDATILESHEVLLGRIEEKEVLREGINRAGEVRQNILRQADVVRTESSKICGRNTLDSHRSDSQVCGRTAVDGVVLSAAGVRRFEAALERMAAA